MRRTGTALRAAIALGLLCGIGVASTEAQSAKIPAREHPQLGIYIFAGERLTSDSMKKLPHQFLSFIRYSGYSRLELCDWSFEYPESKRDDYLKVSQKRIAEAHREGMKVFILELTNMSREWSSISAEPGSTVLPKLMFNPVADPVAFRNRVNDVQESIKNGFSGADGFEVFAGDWGGCIGEGCGYQAFLSFGRAYAQILKRLGLHSELTLNTWAIANWGTTFDPDTTAFWDAETDLSKKVIESDISFADAVTLPGHNLYRGLARQVYAEVDRPVPQWPDRSAIQEIHAKGKRAYLWPHFIVDDDRGRKMTWGKVHFDVRYLKDLAERSRALGIDGTFVNAYNPAAQMGNIFAYGQLNRDPDEAVRTILEKFAGLIAQPRTVPQLTEVFLFLENHSWWGSQMPAQYRLQPLPCRVNSYREAIAILSKVKPLKNSAAPLPMAPDKYLAEIGSTLAFMQHHHR